MESNVDRENNEEASEHIEVDYLDTLIDDYMENDNEEEVSLPEDSILLTASSSKMNTFHPGPIDTSLLTLQKYHVSDLIWRNRECKEIIVKRCDSVIWKEPIHPAVQHKLLQAGFYGVYKSGMVRLDCALITALVERWRPETHTFHLPVGEATITLEDIGILWGLPIEGEVVSGEDRARDPSEWQSECYNMFGVDLGVEAFSQTSMKLKPLIDAIQNLDNQLPDEPTEKQCEQRARMYIALMLGGLLLSDTSGNKMKTMFLPLLSKFDSISTYSWGSATLASLYQGMCRATKHDQNTTSGPFTLIQLWAWERLTGVRPSLKAYAPLRQLIHPLERTWPVPLRNPPRAFRWYRHANHKHISSYTLVAYRDQLDRLKPEQFIWQPYSSAYLPAYCSQGEAVWHAKVPLVCFDIVEYYYPDRVMRQFAFQQLIPTPPIPVTEKHLRGGGRRGKRNEDYKHLHRTHISLWNDRHNKIVDELVTYDQIEYNDAYMQWYRRHTRLLICRPEPHTNRDGYTVLGSSASHMAQALEKIYTQSTPFLTGNIDIDVLRATMNTWRIDIESALKDAGEEWRILPMRSPHSEVPYMSTFNVLAVENPTDDVGGDRV